MQNTSLVSIVRLRIGTGKLAKLYFIYSLEVQVLHTRYKLTELRILRCNEAVLASHISPENLYERKSKRRKNYTSFKQSTSIGDTVNFKEIQLKNSICTVGSFNFNEHMKRLRIRKIAANVSILYDKTHAARCTQQIKNQGTLPSSMEILFGKAKRVV